MMISTPTLFGLAYLALSVLLAAGGVYWQAWAWLLLWPAASVGVVAAGYLWLGPGIFAKQPDGSLPLPRLIFFLPYLLAYWFAYLIVVWRYEQLIGEERVSELMPGILMSRRLAPREIPEGVDRIVDLTSEYPVASEIVERYEYRSLPMLDGHVPTIDDLIAIVDEVNAASGTTLIHCAIGHGRTGLVACSLLLARGLASSPEEAVEQARQRRPHIRLNRTQRAMLEEFHRRLVDRRAAEAGA